MRMLTYVNFGGDKDMHPRDVDELELDELFWLPVISEARSSAQARLADIAEKQNPGMLQYPGGR